MSRTALCVCVVGACCFGTAAVAAGDKEGAAKRARDIVKLLLDGKHDEFIATGTDALRAALTPQQMAQIMRAVNAQAGAYVDEKEVRVTPQGDLASVAVYLNFERAVVHFELTIDADSRLAGVWLRGIDASAAYESPKYANAERFRDAKVEVVNGDYKLPGTLSLPRTAKKNAPAPALVLVHGSGPHDQDETVGANKPFRDIAEGLASRGVAVLRYEKRTKTYGPQLNLERMTLEDETIDDALRAVELLRARPEIDKQRIFVLGHSLGGMAAPFIADRDEQLAGIVILAGSARPILDLVPEQFQYMAELDGAVSPEEQRQLDEVRRQVKAIRAGSFDEVGAPLLGAPSAYWKALDERDPIEPLRRLTMRVLVIAGGRDYQVGEACLARWRAALTDRPNATIRVFPALNHLMIAGTGKSRPQEYQQPGHVDVELIDALAEWIVGAKPGAP